MNNDAEAIKQLFIWLLHELDPVVSAPSGENPNQSTGSGQPGASVPQSQYFDPLDSEEVSYLLADLDESSPLPFRQVSSLEFGEIPAVQDRFQALLKRRLRAEIERNPPRFPWETETLDYDVEYSDVSTPNLVPVHVWATQLQTLKLPVPMPDKVLMQLFDQCRAVVQSSRREGVKLVQAVEALFPGQFQALNQLASLVLSAPSRSGASTLKSNDPQSSGFPSHYDAATPAQQMALSLLAAREMLEAMTLRLSPSQPRVERNWLTDLGVLKLEAEYQPETRQIRIQASLPDRGSLSFRAGNAQSIAEGASPGSLSVVLLNLEPNQTYCLEVQLAGSEQPLVFAVCPMTED